MIEENSGQAKSVPLSEVSHLVSVPLSEVLLYLILKGGSVNLTKQVFTDHIKQPRHSSYFNVQYYLTTLIAYMYISFCAKSLESKVITEEEAGKRRRKKKITHPEYLEGDHWSCVANS